MKTVDIVIGTYSSYSTLREVSHLYLATPSMMSMQFFFEGRNVLIASQCLMIHKIIQISKQSQQPGNLVLKVCIQRHSA